MGDMNDSEFAGKAVIVTGAAQGIGRTIAEQFLQKGAQVLIFDIDGELAVETARQLSAGSEKVMSMAGDVSHREDVHHAVELCIERFGRLDVMVAHAGIADAQPLLEIDDASWQRIMDVNLKGVFLCAQEAGRVMARYGIRVNAIAPGVVLTRIAAWVTEDPVLAAEYLKHIPLHRFAETLDVAKAVLFLASSSAAYITGQTLVLDGGQTLGILVDPPQEAIPGSGRSPGTAEGG
jgi:NAD(P)-dependent dehydrogenase (short-subunit alcohol dehydrogenase family)